MPSIIPCVLDKNGVPPSSPLDKTAVYHSVQIIGKASIIPSVRCSMVAFLLDKMSSIILSRASIIPGDKTIVYHSASLGQKS